MNWTRSYAGYSKRTPKEVKENPNIGPRLEKIKKENLAANTREFVESLIDFFNKKGGLTVNQLNAFEKIESRWSPQEKVKLEEWKKEYLASYQEQAKIISQYYAHTGYFASLSDKILSDENFIPSRKEFNKMVKNKYAQKVLAAHYQIPRFKVSEMVQVRSNVGKRGYDRALTSLRSRLCFVLANDLVIKNACEGAKRYRLLPMGESHPIEIEERYLMKPNKKGRNS